MTKPADSVSIVNLSKLCFKRGTRDIFDEIDIVAEKGKITAIMGPSGTGKTTLLRMIGGQLQPDSGTVSVKSQNLALLSNEHLYQVRRQLGMLFQSGALFTDLSVFENVAFPLREHTDLPEEMIRDLVLMKLEAVGLRGARDLMPASLSGGMNRRVALARAIALDPELIMFDEPFAGQDPISMGILVELIHRLNKALHTSILIVSHDIKETTSIADYIYLLSDAKVVGQGSPEELMASTDPWIKQFMHGLADGPVPFHYPALDYSKDLLDMSL